MPHIISRYVRTPRRQLVAALVTAALVLGLGWYGFTRLTQPENRSCAPGVARPAGSDECIGVNGTGHDFGFADLKDVAEAIRAENATLKDDEYVTVAVLLPLSSTDAGMRIKVLHEVQGAYAYQRRANQESNGRRPTIRLVLANTGQGNAHWRTTVDQLVALADGPERLRAVSGIATSSTEMREAVTALTRAQVAVVGTTITADDIANGPGRKPFPGLARVSPTNSDEADALAHFGRVDAAKALLVQDTRSGDHYVDTLKAAFAASLKNAPLEPQEFTSAPDSTQEGTTANTFTNITHLICDTRAETVFFAGRHTQLRQFINALGDRGCVDRAFTILTGDEGSYLGADKKLDRKALQHKLTVRYAALAHPDAWKPAPGRTLPRTGGSAQAYADFVTDIAKAAPKDRPVALADGQAIIAYDAMATAVHAIRQATPDGSAYPSKEDVGTQWPQVKGSLRVEGASGWICLDNYGNPYNKAIPIVELAQDGTQRFVQMAWPKGRPPTDTCLPPKRG
ncbi:ABC transporter substrate-binding protein [Streptomyces sp. NRRL B-24572]|uniref:ABC transporter substrate-binding protein n=1 Tax=Streptomyces sp. NRRL B-24572 TaxID=1962156 RepID=UPI000A3A726A|nr:ABC transporter substrate-binding protein [Streptomyces sp. NRRL B-24572]